MNNNSFECTLETITPVHIGSGEEYVNGFDIINNKLINIKSVFNHFSSNQSSMSEITEAIEKKQLKDFLDKHNDEVKKYFLAEPRIPDEIGGKNIKKHISNVHNKLYIPGSSIKGSIRTVLIKEEVEKLGIINRSYLMNNRFSKPQNADNNLLKEVVGEDPNHNLLRMLQISDTKQIEFKKIYKLKVFGSNKTESFYEMIPEGTKTNFSIKIDNFLSEKTDYYFKGKIDFYSILDKINNNSVKILEEHLCFEKNLEEKLNYNIIANQFDSLENNEAIINIGAASGYLGITGDLIGNNKTRDIREKYNLAKNRTDFDFPKTRRLINVDGKWLAPGWVKIKIEGLERKELDLKINVPDKKLKLSKKFKKHKIDLKVGDIVKGKVKNIMPYGAFVEIAPGKDGLIHISQISHEHVDEISHFLYVGQEVEVKVIEIKKDGKIDLSKKLADNK